MLGPSSHNLSRTYSCPDLSVLAQQPQQPTSALGQQFSGVGDTGHTLPRRPSLDEYQITFAKDCIECLFARAKPEIAGVLRDMYAASSNLYAKGEISEFAKVFTQLSRQSLSTENSALLDQLAQDYTQRIVKDGLGEKSAFGPWTPNTAKSHQQRSAIEHNLAFLAQQIGGDVLALGNRQIAHEVLPFIQNCLESHIGRTLDGATAQRLEEVVDQAAQQAFDALRQQRRGMSGLQGVGVGKLARDLDTVAMLPLLLRNLLSHLPHPQDIPPKINTPVTPTNPEPSTSPAAGIAVHIGTINIGDTINKYGNVKLGHGGLAGGGGITLPPGLVNVTQKQNNHNNVDPLSTTGKLAPVLSELQTAPTVNVSTSTSPVRTEQPLRDPISTLSSSDVITTDETLPPPPQWMLTPKSHSTRLPPQPPVGQLSSPPLVTTTRVEQVASSSVNLPSGRQESVVPPDWLNQLKFRKNNWQTPAQDYLHSTAFHASTSSQKAEVTFMQIVREALELDNSLSISQPRREFEKMRAAVLPAFSESQARVLTAFQWGGSTEEQNSALQNIETVLRQYPEKAALQTVARMMVRETNLQPRARAINPLIERLLTAIEQEHPRVV
jgi:hypothetical protein